MERGIPEGDQATGEALADGKVHSFTPKNGAKIGQ